MTLRLPYVLHEHIAKRAGKHYDLRIQYPRRKKLASFALPKHKIPFRIGEKVLAVQTEDHSLTWLDFEGEIESGYGAGTVKIIQRGSLTVYLWSDRYIRFKSNDRGPLNGTYALIRMDTYVRTTGKGQKGWLLIRTREVK